MNDKIKAAFDEIRADRVLIDNTYYHVSAELRKRKGRNARFSTRMRLGTTAAVMASVFICVFVYSFNFVAVAYVGIDMEPSVELSLNRRDRVIAASSFNEGGTKLLEETDLRGRPYGEAAALLVSAAQFNGYVRSDTLISFTVLANDDEKERSLCHSLQSFANDDSLSLGHSAEIEIFPVTADIWESARNHHMSPAKYLALRELLEVDENAVLEDYNNSTIPQIRQECQSKHETSESDYINTHSQGGHGHRMNGRHGH